MTSGVRLRDVTEADLPIFYEQQLDPAANVMAAFTAKDPADREAFLAHWHDILADDTDITRTIVADEQVAGNLVCYLDSGQREVGYWLGTAFWGKGIATRALSLFLETYSTRPLYARVAKDNLASRRVLEKCGFVVVGEDRGFSHARGQDVEELVLALPANAAR